MKENVCWHQKQLCDPDTMVSALQPTAGVTRKAQGMGELRPLNVLKERFHCYGTINKHSSLKNTCLSRTHQEMAKSQSPPGSISGIRCLLHLRERIVPLGGWGKSNKALQCSDL